MRPSSGFIDAFATDSSQGEGYLILYKRRVYAIAYARLGWVDVDMHLLICSFRFHCGRAGGGVSICTCGRAFGMHVLTCMDASSDGLEAGFDQPARTPHARMHDTLSDSYASADLTDIDLVLPVGKI